MNLLNYFIIVLETWLLNTESEYKGMNSSFLVEPVGISIDECWMCIVLQSNFIQKPRLEHVYKNKANFWFVSQIFVSKITIIMPFEYLRMQIVNGDCWISKDFQSLTIRNGLSSDYGDDVANACFWQYDKIIWMHVNWR